MSTYKKELNRRVELATAHITAMYGNPDAEYSVNAYVEHAIEELETSYWQAKLGIDTPSPEQVMKLLVLHSAWSADDFENGMDNLDFSLPDNVTDYVICVKFDADGNIESMHMES